MFSILKYLYLLPASWSNIAVAALFMGISVSANADTWRFPGKAASIQETIDLAGDNDTIIVAEGHYYENIVIRGKAIMLTSEFIMDGDKSHIQRTIIDGSHWSDSLRRSTILLIECKDTTTVIQGLTIRGGSGSQIFVGPAEHWCGGGVFVYECSGKVQDNIVEHNHLNYKYSVNVGSGIMAATSNGHFIIIRNNLIRNNSIETVMEATAAGLWAGVGKNGHIIAENNRILHNSTLCLGPFEAHGGGVVLFGFFPEKASILFRKNLVAQNQVDADSGAGALGGGLEVIYYDFKSESRVQSPFLQIFDNRILENISSDRGGGIALREASQSQYQTSPVCPQVFLSGNTITGNRAVFGSGIHNFNLSFIMVGNFLKNDLSIDGSFEIFNDDVGYAFLNHGIINAYDNQVQGDWPSGRGILQDYPYVRSFAHRWKVKQVQPGMIKMNWVPPAWRQWWAISLYLLGLTAIFWLYRQYLFYRFNLKATLELERKENERIRQLDKIRTRLFANISHEFRTPLTLIIAPVEDIIKNGFLKEKHKRYLQMVCRNVLRLQQLTNQLMDLSKLESGSVKLEVTKGDPAKFVTSIASSYISLAESRNIRYRMDICEMSGDLYFDADKLEKIINNLLFNAFKFTPNGGKVEISLKPDPKTGANKAGFYTLIVSDSGKGMTAEQQQKVFERFYSEGRIHSEDPEGIGIGMSMVKDLVHLYRGTIRVNSEPGLGSSFEVTLPTAESQFAPEEISESPPREFELQSIKSPSKQTKLTESEKAGEKRGKKKAGKSPVILIVEDNDDLRNYIVGHFDEEMEILEAANGRVALELARERIPDLVISDLMMPEMDGVALLQELRKDDHTCHIPFFMLTARDDMAIKTESFQKGTDEYIEKPFHSEELRARVQGMLDQRMKLAQHYRREFLQDPELFINQRCKEQFMTRIIECIRAELSNEEFSVSMLSNQMHISRVQLYRKISAITGFSPVEFIRNIRLKVAAELLREGDLNVTQVMMEVGIGSPSYFAEVFREVFGCNPSEYRSSMSDKFSAQRGKHEDV